MTIGDQRYSRTSKVLKFNTLPGTDAVGDAVRGSLRSAYSYGQQATRFLGAWSAPHFRNRLEWRVASTVSTDITLFKARVWLPEHVDRVRASFIYGVPSEEDYEVREFIDVGTFSRNNTNIVEAAVGDAFAPPSYSPIGGVPLPPGGTPGEFLLPVGRVVRSNIDVEVDVASGGESLDCHVYLRRNNADSTDFLLHTCVVTAETDGA